MDRFSRSRRTLSAVHGWLSLAAVITLLCLTLGFSPHASAQTAPKVHRKVIQMVEPEYPTILKNGHFEGQVRLDATVLPNGSVTKVEVRGGNPMLSQYAQQAVMKWKYAPGPDKTVEEVVFVFNPGSR